MVARGDLGVEMPAEEVPLLQKELIRKANSLGIPIITEFPYIKKMSSNKLDILWKELDIKNKLISLLNSKIS